MVARWEFWSLATMLIVTHSDGAELDARKSLTEAIEIGNSGEIVMRKNVMAKLAESRASTPAATDKGEKSR